VIGRLAISIDFKVIVKQKQTGEPLFEPMVMIILKSSAQNVRPCCVVGKIPLDSTKDAFEPWWRRLFFGLIASI